MDIMNNVTTVHSCAEHSNRKCGIGTAFDSLNRDKYVFLSYKNFSLVVCTRNRGAFIIIISLT